MDRIFLNDKYLFFVDAETDGLYGNYISIAVIVTDNKCREIDRLYIGIARDNLLVTDSWTKIHVIPILGEYETYDSEEAMLERFWSFWCQYRMKSYAVGDVIFPVEARLFQKCINKNLEERKFHGPFPFLDLSSIFFAEGMDPLIERSQPITQKIGHNGENMQHNALYDVQVMVELFKRIISY